MTISVCVASIRALTATHLVNALIKQEFEPWELIIAAQGNEPEYLSAMRAIEARDARIRVTYLRSFGQSAGRNAAVQLAGGEILAFTDDDCVPATNWLSVMAAKFAAEPEVGIVAGDLIASSAPRFRVSCCPATHTIELIYDPSKYENGAPAGFYWGGANFAVRRRTWDEVGPFDTHLGPGTEFPSAEDTDYCLRAENLGVVMHTTPAAVVHHTYGRRYGFGPVTRHFRNYALGSGALLAKLELTGHRLAREWAIGQSSARDLLRCPRRYLFDLHRTKYYREGRDRFLEKYYVDARGLSRLKLVDIRQPSLVADS
jgi:GT2 family glycosyltransferase